MTLACPRNSSAGAHATLLRSSGGVSWGQFLEAVTGIKIVCLRCLANIRRRNRVRRG